MNACPLQPLLCSTVSFDLALGATMLALLAAVLVVALRVEQATKRDSS